MGATLSCDCCRQAIPQGNGPTRPPRCGRHQRPDANAPLPGVLGRPERAADRGGEHQPGGLHERTAWLIIGQENTRRTAAMQQTARPWTTSWRPRRRPTAVPYQTCFWCGMEVAMRRPHCFRCRRLLLIPTARDEGRTLHTRARMCVCACLDVYQCSCQSFVIVTRVSSSRPAPHVSFSAPFLPFGSRNTRTPLSFSRSLYVSACCSCLSPPQPFAGADCGGGGGGGGNGEEDGASGSACRRRRWSRRRTSSSKRSSWRRASSFSYRRPDRRTVSLWNPRG